MRIIKTIKAGAKGSRRFLKQWGDQLVAVLYRKDERQQRTLTTIELIVDERPLLMPHSISKAFSHRETAMPLPFKLILDELKLRVAVKGGGARWSQCGRLRVMRYGDAAKLGLGSIVVTDGIGRCTDGHC